MRWQKRSFRIDVKKGDVLAFCRCGKTQKPPYCDGSHRGSDIEPYRVTFTEDKSASICGCGASKNRPFCDGTHRSLPEEE